MKARAFTLVELLIAVVITGILAMVAMANYQGARDRADTMVDEANQKILLMAVKLYAADQDALPGSLSRLRPRDLERAYALWQAEPPTRPKTVLAWQAVWGPALAEAKTIFPDFVKDPNVFQCPTRKTTQPVSVSNGRLVNANFALTPLMKNADGTPLSLSAFNQNADRVAIAEVDGQGNFIFIHRGGVAVATTAGGKHLRVKAGDCQASLGGSNCGSGGSGGRRSGDGDRGRAQ